MCSLVPCLRSGHLALQNSRISLLYGRDVTASLACSPYPEPYPLSNCFLSREPRANVGLVTCFISEPRLLSYCFLIREPTANIGFVDTSGLWQYRSRRLSDPLTHCFQSPVVCFLRSFLPFSVLVIFERTAHPYTHAEVVP